MKKTTYKIVCIKALPPLLTEVLALRSGSSFIFLSLQSQYKKVSALDTSIVINLCGYLTYLRMVKCQLRVYLRFANNLKLTTTTSLLSPFWIWFLPLSGQQNHSMELHHYIQHSQSRAFNDNILTVEHTTARLEQPKPAETLFLW